MESVYTTSRGEERVGIERSDRGYVVRLRERRYEVTVAAASGGRFVVMIDGTVISGAYARTQLGLEIAIGGEQHVLVVPEGDADTWRGAAGGVASDGRVTTPMPGKIAAVHAGAGDRVEAGHALVVLEAMKMQNDIVAPVAGTVRVVHHEVGDNVEFGDVLVEIEPDERADST